MYVSNDYTEADKGLFARAGAVYGQVLGKLLIIEEDVSVRTLCAHASSLSVMA